MFKDPLIDANRRRFGPFLLEPLEPRWFLDATPLDLPATVQGSFPQTYDVALKAGLLYRFDANQGWIKIDCLDWHSYYNTNLWDALLVRPAKDEDCVLSVQNASPEASR